MTTQTPDAQAWQEYVRPDYLWRNRLADILVLQCESRGVFLQLHDHHVQRLQPAGFGELMAVQQFITARWREIRFQRCQEALGPNPIFQTSILQCRRRMKSALRNLEYQRRAFPSTPQAKPHARPALRKAA